MKLMNIAEIKLNHFADYQDIVLFMKNIGLIKDKSRPRQFHNNTGEIYYEWNRKNWRKRIDTTSNRWRIAWFKRDNKLFTL